MLARVVDCVVLNPAQSPSVCIADLIQCCLLGKCRLKSNLRASLLQGLPFETAPGNAGIFRRTNTPVNWTKLTSSNKRPVTITLSSVLASMAVIVARQMETLHDIFFKEREMQSFYSWFISDGSKKLKPITFSNSKRMSPNFYSP